MDSSSDLLALYNRDSLLDSGSGLNSYSNSASDAGPESRERADFAPRRPPSEFFRDPSWTPSSSLQPGGFDPIPEEETPQGSARTPPEGVFRDLLSSQILDSSTDLLAGVNRESLIDSISDILSSRNRNYSPSADPSAGGDGDGGASGSAERDGQPPGQSGPPGLHSASWKVDEGTLPTPVSAPWRPGPVRGAANYSPSAGVMGAHGPRTLSASSLDPSDIEICAHEDGNPWFLGSGSFGQVRSLLNFLLDLLILFSQPNHGKLWVSLPLISDSRFSTSNRGITVLDWN